MRIRGLIPLSMMAISLLVLTSVAAADARHSSSDRATSVDRVFSRLLSVIEPMGEYEWPPIVEIGTESGINAYATTVSPQNRGGKPRAKVVIHDSMLTEVIEGHEDRLAFILGHELGHIVLGHVLQRDAAESTPFLSTAFTREQEIDADRKGMELALTAGYSYRRALDGIHRMVALGLEYSSFEGIGVDHPSWKERLTFLDEEQASLWTAMTAFHDGTVFLMIEQYPAAERCFRRVTKEFPSCSEAWANLGYALLMQYCDALETDDLRRLGVGQIICGGFYRRPMSLEAQVRGIDEELWWEAVGALREALRLDPNLTLAKANLGVAYLVRPAGKDVGRAAKYLGDAVEAAERDETLDPMARAAVFINAGVADLAGGDKQLCSQRLNQAASESENAFAGRARQFMPRNAISSALLYNRILLMADSHDEEELRDAPALMEKYLRRSSPSSAWWSLAYENYETFCDRLGISPKSRDELISSDSGPLRCVCSVAVGPGHLVTLADPVEEVEELLGSGEEVPIVAGTNLRRLRYPSYGVDLLVSDRVLAICLVGPSAPPLPVQGTGLAAQSINLRVGMKRAELSRVLDMEDYDFRQLTDSEINFRFYRNIGLAVRIKSGLVAELVIAQIPERRLVAAG